MIVYGRQSHDSRFYWYCGECEKYGHDDRLSFVYVAGQAHERVNHG